MKVGFHEKMREIKGRVLEQTFIACFKIQHMITMVFLQTNFTLIEKFTLA